ncbi:hypothetical protein FLLO111716_03485 [Flavobacterium longum]
MKKPDCCENVGGSSCPPEPALGFWAAGVTKAMILKLPVPLGWRPSDWLLGMAVAGATSTVTLPGAVSVMASPPPLIFQLVCNGWPGVVRFLSEHQMSRYPLAGKFTFGNTHL